MVMMVIMMMMMVMVMGLRLLVQEVLWLVREACPHHTAVERARWSVVSVNKQVIRAVAGPLPLVLVQPAQRRQLSTQHHSISYHTTDAAITQYFTRSKLAQKCKIERFILL